MNRVTDPIHFAWATVVAIAVIAFAVWLVVATPQYSANYTERVDSCVRGGMQWIDSNCIIGR